MSTRRPRLSTPLSDALVPLHDFVAFCANVMDAHTAALFVEDRGRGCLRMVAGWSLSEHLIAEAEVSIEGTDLAKRYHAGQPSAEPYFEGDSSALGMYARAEPIRAYMTAPVGSLGLLWLDTRKAYRFTAKHLKILADLARTAEHLLRLSVKVTTLQGAQKGRRVVQSLLAHSRAAQVTEEEVLDSAVRLIVESMDVDGALTAFRLPHRDLCQITACCGLPPFIRAGRVVRLADGWAKWALNNRKPAFAGVSGDKDPDVVAFHAGERFGFPVRSLGVVPWHLDEQDRDELLIVASATAGEMGRDECDLSETVADTIRLIQTACLRKRLLDGVRRYDAESGALCEGAFFLESRQMLSRARETGGGLALVLLEVANMERLYMEHAPKTVNRVLETLTDTMTLMQPRQAKIGKFKTGGFGLLVASAKEQEVRAFRKKAQYLFGTGYVSVEGRNVHYSMAMAVAHFPSDCSDIEGLWSTARTRLALPSSSLYRWSSLSPGTHLAAKALEEEQNNSTPQVDAP